MLSAKVGDLEATLDADIDRERTAKRIFERLRGGHGFTGGITIVKDECQRMRQSMPGRAISCVRARLGLMACETLTNPAAPVIVAFPSAHAFLDRGS
jgi:hypothetical protein